MEASLAPPQDSGLVLAIFYYMSIGTLIPWNFFINVNGYWMYKFRTVSNHTLEMSNNTVEMSGVGNGKNFLQIEFTSDLAIAAMIPNVTFLVLNGIVGHRFKMAPRLLSSLLMVVLLFTITLVLVKVDTDAWQLEFLIVTLLVVVILNIFSATFQGGLFGLAGCFPPRYMTGVLNGMGIGGIIVATINIVLLALGGDDVTAAFYCFLFSVIFLTGAVMALYYLTTTPHYAYYVQEAGQGGTETTPLLEGESSGTENKSVSVGEVLRGIKVEALTVLIIYIVTLGCFPALTVLVEAVDRKEGGAWEKIYFVPVCCFLVYNIGDYIGRVMAGLSIIPNISSRLALISSVLRVLIIPGFMFCNLAPQERNHIEIYFSSDAAYIILMVLLSVSNGYLTSVVMMNAPAKVEVYQQQTASNLMAGILGLGLVIGAGLSAGLVNAL